MDDSAHTANNFELGQIDTFAGDELGGCNGFSLFVFEDGVERILINHGGTDGWRPSWVRVLFEDGSFKQCTNPDNLGVDDFTAIELNCDN